MGYAQLDILKKRSDNAAIGIGTMIIFIAMILVAGIAASVLIQTMDQLQSQAMKTGQDTILDVSTGVTISQITGKVGSSKITNLAIMISPLLSTATVNLSSTILSLSDSNIQVVFQYNQSCYASSPTQGLFSSINTSNLQSNEFGIIVIRDSDNSCNQNTPNINDEDLVVLVVNATKSFSGISTRTNVLGRITPEQGIPSTISFTVPSVLSDTIVDL